MGFNLAFKGLTYKHLHIMADTDVLYLTGGSGLVCSKCHRFTTPL